MRTKPALLILARDKEKEKNKLNSKHKFTLLTLAFLISEILAVIMTTSIVISLFIFPESDSAEFARMSQHLPPRLIDEITGVILNVCAVPVFLLSIFGIVESVRLFKKKKSSWKTTVIFIFSILNLLISGIIVYGSLIFFVAPRLGLVQLN